ncbi:MAG: VWA domain-containing protein [Planctomycetota bacterium]|nr:VWA domain-containing protein [Planctomycetota bacterium]
MNWPGILEPWSAWLFLLLIPLIIFYFLKLKRPQLDVSSLALWRSVINDQRVNSPFQRFKRSLLLLLQILLLCSLVLAAMRPFLPSGADRAQYLPVLIDCSASMAALDKAGGESRLAVAKEEVTKLIDNLLPGQRLSLIGVSNSARSLCEFIDNKRVLHDALDKLQVQHTSSRLEDGLRMAQALSLTVPIETVMLFTDGNVPPLVNFDLPFQLNFQKIEAPGANVGITAVNAQRTRERWDVFVRLDATENSQMTTTVELWRDGKIEGSELLTVEGGKSQRVVFPITDLSAASLEVRIKPDTFDSLTLDNQAFLDLPSSRDLVVYCPLSLMTYRQALQGTPGVLLYPNDDGGGTAAFYDLLISDQPSHADFEARMMVLVGFVPTDLKDLIEITTDVAEVVDWQRSAPLLQYVSLKDLMFGDEPKRRPGTEDKAFEERGYEILAQGRSGPLVLQKVAGGKDQYSILFHTERSTLVYRVGFPVLVKNTLDEARKLAGLSEAKSQPTGLLTGRIMTPETDYTVVAPDGVETHVKTTVDGLLSGVPAPQIGRYSIRTEGKEVASAGVSLQSTPETELSTVDALQMKETRVGASQVTLKTDRPLWPWFALAGFALLLIEWWYFQKRPAGMPG